MKRRSSLLPDDVHDFESASADRDERAGLAPPYDPEAEALRSERKRKAAPARRTRAGSTRELRDALASSDPFLLKVMRKQMKRMRKVAIKNGIDFREVDLWEL